MSMDWIRAGVREEHIRSLYKEETWEQLFEKFPEIKEVSIIGGKGTGKPSVSVNGVSKEDRIEIYATLDDSFETEKEKKSIKLLKKLYRFLSEQKMVPDRLEVKLETKYIGDYSGFVLRDDLPNPLHFWYQRGIPGFHERVTFTRSTE